MDVIYLCAAALLFATLLGLVNACDMLGGRK